MPSAVIDACCLVDLLASGHAEAILRAGDYAWHLPVSVQAEVRFVRQPDPAQPGRIIQVAADLSSLLRSGLLKVCQPANQPENDLFTQYATRFRSDGEAMCLALAESRGWLVATDDRKAIRIGQQAGLTVISSPQIIKTWADNAQPAHPILVQSLKDIEVFAQFRPNSTMPEFQWWLDRLAGP